MHQLLAKPVVTQKQEALRRRIQQFSKRFRRVPQLAVVLVGDDPASLIYTRRKGEMAAALGMQHQTVHLPVKSSPAEVKTIIDGLNADPKVDGILIQRPLPSGFSESEVLYWVAPEKDVDAFHPLHAGRLVLGLPCLMPCTPAGIITLLEHYQIPLAGKVACVVGRSSIVGKPMAALLLRADATVLHCHSKTPDLASFTRQAEVLIVAAGKPGLITASHVRPGAVVVDVGVHRTSEGRIVGDVQFDQVAPVASALSPVPGGVGPMTIMTLMENTMAAAETKEETDANRSH